MTSDGQLYHRAKFKQIISEQVTLGYLTKGGVSYSDSEEMTPYERKIALDTVRDIIDSEVKAKEKAIQDAKIARDNRSPKSRLTK